MSNKKWVKVFLTFSIIVVSFIVLINFTIDPLWTFDHSNKFNNAQPGFNERQQKTNRAYFSGLEKYDTLLLGSSRSTYINQYDFAGMNVFNYASNNMLPYEYNDWINIAKKIKGKEFKTIIIGMDFWGSSNGIFYKDAKKGNQTPAIYFETTKSGFYRYKQLLSISTFKKSASSVIHSFIPGTTDYSRKNIKSTIFISKERKKSARDGQFKLYSTEIYGSAYHYNINIQKYFKQLKKNNPNTKFIIYTTPISKELFELLTQSGNLRDYKKWLKVLVDEFDAVYNFMGINTITSNKNNYPDLHHFYPFIGTLIANKISKKENDNIPNDFGIILTKDNIDTYFKK
jgi:hypothetical protein